MPWTGRKLEPIAMAFGDAPHCRRCGEIPARIEYARNMTKNTIAIVVVCKAHNLRRDLDVERIASRSSVGLLDAIALELRRRFVDAILFSSLPLPPSRRVPVVRRPVACAACDAPSDPAVAGCAYCGAHLAASPR